MLINRNKRKNLLNDYVTPGHPSAFSGRNRIRKLLKNKLSNDEVNKEILSYNHSYTVHRSAKKPRLFNPYLAFSPRKQIQADLIDFQLLKNFNDGVRYLLVCIDIFTKKIWVEPLKQKNADQSELALRKIFQRVESSPASIKRKSQGKSLLEAIFFDRGTEFTNNKVRQLCQSLGVKIIHPKSHIKAAIVERVNQTLQKLIYQYMTDRQSRRYIDVLEDLVQTYNSRSHRTLNGISPNEAEDPKNLSLVRNIVFDNRRNHVVKGRKMKAKFKVGDIVHIEKEKNPFSRGYEERFNQEYFKIISINHQLPIITYSIKSMNSGEVIDGQFYAEELQLVRGDVFKVEKVIKSRTRRGRKEYFVKWLNFNDQHNSWISAKDIQ